MQQTDVLIIGAGPAGLTAAIYVLRAGFQAIVFDRNLYGGQVATTDEIENYPAIAKITGADFSIRLYEQAVSLGAEVRFEEVRKVELESEKKRVETDQESYEAPAVILANGAKRRKLGCPGEEALLGKGVSYCATCDGAFFKKKAVAVVGGGNTALEDALFLSNLCEKVYLIHRRDSFRGEKYLVDSVMQKENISILYNKTVSEMKGTETVTGIKIADTFTQETEILQVNGVFVAIGLEPDNHLYSNVLPVNKQGYLLVDETCTTALPGVYVAGDSREKPLRQIITAAADGAVAAVQAGNYLNWKKNEH